MERHNFDNKLIRPPEDISDDRTRDEIIGIIELDYWGNDTPRVSQEIFLKGKTYHSIFFVVEDIQFDLVIGRRTIQEDTFTKRNIFTTNPLDGTNQGGFTFRIDPAGGTFLSKCSTSFRRLMCLQRIPGKRQEECS